MDETLSPMYAFVQDTEVLSNLPLWILVYERLIMAMKDSKKRIKSRRIALSKKLTILFRSMF